uniref:Uncharacterized protein n=1 Tax=Astyanax mexicanus TaxID=7994 RepID=A0A3B1IDL5_ASTMX
AVALRLHVQVEVRVRGHFVRAQAITAHVRVHGGFQGETRACARALRDLHGHVRLGESGRVVVDVQNLRLHAKQLQRVLEKHLQVQQARRRVYAAHALPVDLLTNVQRAAFQVDIQVGRARAGHRLKAARRQLGGVQPQVLRDVAHERAQLRLLSHGVEEGAGMGGRGISHCHG